MTTYAELVEAVAALLAPKLPKVVCMERPPITYEDEGVVSPPAPAPRVIDDGMEKARATANELAASIIALIDASRWRPIKTAPKDGTHILVFPALLAYPLVASWERPARTPPTIRARGEETGHFGFWRVAMSEARVPYDPTHWMPCPLPFPPEQESPR